MKKKKNKKLKKMKHLSGNYLFIHSLVENRNPNFTNRSHLRNLQRKTYSIHILEQQQTYTYLLHVQLPLLLVIHMRCSYCTVST